MLLQQRLGPVVLLDDQAQDAELLGVGQREGDNVNVVLRQQSAQLAQAAGLVFEEYG